MVRTRRYRLLLEGLGLRVYGSNHLCGKVEKGCLKEVIQRGHFNPRNGFKHLNGGRGVEEYIL